MSTSSCAKQKRLLFAGLFGMFFLIPQARSADAPSPVHAFGAAQVQEVYRVVLDRDALLLESITDMIRQKNITDGFVTVSAGSVQECTYHYVTSAAEKPIDAYKTVKGHSRSSARMESSRMASRICTSRFQTRGKGHSEAILKRAAAYSIWAK